MKKVLMWSAVWVVGCSGVQSFDCSKVQKFKSFPQVRDSIVLWFNYSIVLLFISLSLPKFILLNQQKQISQFIAKTSAGLEGVLAEELKNLGANNIEPVKRAITFEGDKSLMYRANYCLRTALSVLKHITSFTAQNDHELYDGIYQIHWHDYLSTDKTFAIDAVVSGSHFVHSQYAALKAKDAIADQFRDRYGRRPSVNIANPDLRIHLHISNDQVNLAFNSSGESLHKRGYRKNVDKAPINEVLAAGLILLSGWNADTHFVDCMCGSGTIPIEAAMFAMNIPAGYYRKDFGFMHWGDFDKALWKQIIEEANSQMKDFDRQIIASDRSYKATEIAHENVSSAHLHKDIKIVKRSMEDFKPPKGTGILIINPPYGERLEEEDIQKLYSTIGDSLKRNFSGYRAWIVSSDFHALKHVGLKPSKKITVFNGPLECRYVCFDIFAGSHKEMKIRQAEDKSVVAPGSHSK